MKLFNNKQWMFYCIGVPVLLIVSYLSMPYYARQALIHLMPTVDDLQTFHRDTVCRAAHAWHWPHASDYNSCHLPPADEAYLDSFQTLSFLVIQRDSLVHESYRNGWNDTLTSNIYSATKTIVGLLVGIALDEGKIQSLDDPVSRYLPCYTKGMQANVTLRHLLTMSGEMDWDESYASLFSVTTHGYYGNDLYELATGLDVSAPLSALNSTDTVPSMVRLPNPSEPTVTGTSGRSANCSDTTVCLRVSLGRQRRVNECLLASPSKGIDSWYWNRSVVLFCSVIGLSPVQTSTMDSMSSMASL